MRHVKIARKDIIRLVITKISARHVRGADILCTRLLKRRTIVNGVQKESTRLVMRVRNPWHVQNVHSDKLPICPNTVKCFGG